MMFITPNPHPRRSAPMPRPVPIPVRLVIRKRWHEGQSALQIAHDLELSVRTVRFFIARFRSGDDASSGTAYRTEPAARSPRSQAVHNATIDLRRNHPKWGAELLRIQLSRMGHAVPSARTLRRWLRRAGLS
jgi:transposase